ncbi:hypothetical protein IT157_04600 [bacterium]|nr:hypothetical protein [bacterium]
MKPLLKFWLASSLIIAMLSWWPLNYIQEWAINAASPRQQIESRMLEEARLLEDFLLDDSPVGKGRASSPKVWETALKARIYIRESAGEAIGQIGGAGDQQERVAKLLPGQGALVENSRGLHYIYEVERTGKGQYLVISRESRSVAGSKPGGEAPPSALAMALALGLIGGGLVTLLARVALPTPAKEKE